MPRMSLLLPLTMSSVPEAQGEGRIKWNYLPCIFCTLTDSIADEFGRTREGLDEGGTALVGF